jgi:hypothetical protein
LDSRHSSVAPSFYEEAITPESAKDSARYHPHDRLRLILVFQAAR